MEVACAGRNAPRVRLYRHGMCHRLVTLFFFLSYAVILYWCWETIGEQHNEALIQLYGKGEGGKPAALSEKEIAALQAAAAAGVSIERFNQPNAENDLKPKSDDKNPNTNNNNHNHNNNVKSNAPPLDPSAPTTSSSSSSSAGGSSSSSAADSEPELPSALLPSFWALFALCVTGSLHGLFKLLQIWSLRFLCFAQLKPARDLESATHAFVVPPSKQERSEVAEISNLPGLGISFVFRRRRYFWDDDLPHSELNNAAPGAGEEKKDEEATKKKKKDDDFDYGGSSSSRGAFVKVKCPTKMDISFFRSWRGLQSADEVDARQQRYGLNKFEMTMPTFLDLFQKQLLSPFTVFQLFGMLLWCLDSYISYTLFTLCLILLFEATTVFTRLKNLSTLKGIGAKPKELLVFRGNAFVTISSEELLPGDLFSLKFDKNDPNVPCDCLLLRGSAIVNEASLTGESIPQMKEALPWDGGASATLAIKSSHSLHVLFGGTTLLQGGEAVSSSLSRPSEEEEEEGGGGGEKQKKKGLTCVESIPSAPDGGALCFVLRTGFASSEGKLVRMLEGSVDHVRSDTWDVALLLLLLLVFALLSAGYVLQRGLEEQRSRYDLLLHCIMIVTSVVPPELPMQMALAVNQSLMTLMRMHVFCTEPFRVPIAGQVDVACFDKTGTLTSDQLVAVGIVPNPHEGTMNKDGKLTDMSQVSGEAAMVLGACHSLFVVDDKVAGDPLEEAAIKAIKWELVSDAGVGTGTRKSAPKPGGATSTSTSTPAAPPKDETNGANPNMHGTLCRPFIKAAGASRDFAVGQDTCQAVSIVHRHHFSSALQRMSVVARSASRVGQSSKTARYFVLTKGSAEMIGTLVKHKPRGYDESAAALAKNGMRVIALAYKILPNDSTVQSAMKLRSAAESDLVFAGFVAFTCRVRKETADVLKVLKDGSHAVIMVTGDALPTAVHVAVEVGMIAADKNVFVLTENDKGEFLWTVERCPKNGVPPADVVFDPAAVSVIAGHSELAVTGPTLAAALERFPQFRTQLVHIAVYARMQPDAKKELVAALRDMKKVVLMCGDGANDVGALRQADVGVALLSGFGDVNVDRGEDAVKKEVNSLSEAQLNELPVKEIKDKLRILNVDLETKHAAVKEKMELVKLLKTTAAPPVVVPTAVAAKENAAKLKEQREKMKVEMEKRRVEMRLEYEQLAKEVGVFEATKRIFAKQKEEAKKQAELNKGSGGLAMQAQRLAATLEDGQEMDFGDLGMVKVGDASLAAPFTAKVPSVKPVADIIRQGRCTHVSTIQMYQILSLNSLILAYTLSVLHLDGVKYGDMQMTALGILNSISFISMSRSQPLPALSKERCPRSIFHPSLILSLLGQFVVHVVSLHFAVQLSKVTMGSDYAPPPPKAEFKPSLLNSVVFLASAIQHLSVFVVNLKGAPFMSGVMDNNPLLMSLGATFVLSFLAASEMLPTLNTWLQLVPFPTLAFRNTILLVLGADVVLSFLWDRLMVMIFSPLIFKASVQSLTRQDVMKIFRILWTMALIAYFLSSADLDDETMRELGYDVQNTTDSSSAAANVVSAVVENVTAAASGYFEDDL